MIYYLSLGSNLGDREATLRQALQLIEQQIGPVRRCSSFYYSKPWGFASENDFCNLCCAVESSLSPLALLSFTQSIERALGRIRIEDSENEKMNKCKNAKMRKYSDRPIDIDLILAFDDSGNEIHCEITNDQMVNILSLPHPLWQQRDFVKVPLAEILPQNLP